MWHYGKTVRYVASYSSSKKCFAIMNGIAGMTDWLAIKPGSTDGVTNIITILTEAVGSGRQVNVEITSNQITGVYMS